MKLKEYLQNKNTITLLRITKNGKHRTEGELYEADPEIEQLPKEEKDELITDTIDHIHNKKETKGLHVFSTGSIDYPGIGPDKIADIAVITTKPEEGKIIFEEAKQKAEQHRTKLLTWFEKEIKPFVQKLKKDDKIEAAIIRGDLLSPNRYPNENSDVDIMLFTNQDQKHPYQEELKEKLKTSPGRIYYDIYNFTQKSYSATGVKIKDAKGNQAEYAVVPIPNLKEHVKHSGIFHKRGKPIEHMKYYQDQGKHAQVIFDKTGIGKQFIHWMKHGKKAPKV